MKTTTKSFEGIIEKTKRLKIFELNTEELDLYQVSEHSQFKDWAWFLSNPTPGACKTQSKLNWNMELFDGSRLTDAHHSERLRWAKILVLTLLVVPHDGRKAKPGSMSAFQKELKWLLSWMSNTGYYYPHEFTPLGKH